MATYRKRPADGQCTYVFSSGDKCGQPYKASGYCQAHYERHRIGRDMDAPVRTFRCAPTEDRFWEKVDKRDDGCWLWMGSRDAEPFDYGQFYDGRVGRARRAHVVSWELTHGRPVPYRLMVMHDCDNPPCVRPDHLVLGDHDANMQHMVESQRSARGSANGKSRLTVEIVRQIRLDYKQGFTQKQLAAQYGVIQQTISQVVRRKTWTHI